MHPQIRFPFNPWLNTTQAAIGFHNGFIGFIGFSAHLAIRFNPFNPR